MLLLHSALRRRPSSPDVVGQQRSFSAVIIVSQCRIGVRRHGGHSLLLPRRAAASIVRHNKEEGDLPSLLPQWQRHHTDLFFLFVVVSRTLILRQGRYRYYGGKMGGLPPNLA